MEAGRPALVPASSITSDPPRAPPVSHSAAGRPIVNTTAFPDLAGWVAGVHALNLTAGWYANNCHCADPGPGVAHFVGDVDAMLALGFDK